MTAPGARWTPAPHRSPWRVGLLVAGVLLAVLMGLVLVWSQNDVGSASPESSPTASPPGLSGGETFSIDFRSELWVSGVLITAHSGNDSPDRSAATYSVSGPGFETIEVSDVPGVVVDIPGWGRLTAEGVRSESIKNKGKPGETGAIPPSGTLYFRAVTDFPLVENSQVLPAED